MIPRYVAFVRVRRSLIGLICDDGLDPTRAGAAARVDSALLQCRLESDGECNSERDSQRDVIVRGAYRRSECSPNSDRDAHLVSFHESTIELRQRKGAVVPESAGSRTSGTACRLHPDPFIQIADDEAVEVPYINSVERQSIRMRPSVAPKMRSSFHSSRIAHRYLTRSDTLIEFHSQVLPSSAEKAWLQIGRCGLRTSHRKTMTMR
jgi:hypothetical protein